MMKEKFEKFCNLAKVSSLTKIEAAIHFIWFNQRMCEHPDIDIKTVNSYFEKAHLAAIPHSRLKEYLIRSPQTTRSSQVGRFKLKRSALENLDQKYHSKLGEEKIPIKERVALSKTPFLSSSDVSDAHQMAELYVITYCYENSVRRFVETVLSREIGPNWWDLVKNNELEKKYITRKAKETKEKWVSSRGKESPLFYIDWPDLVKIIRKEENRFVPYINDINFVHMRFEELERVRNVIAHHGTMVGSDEFDRIILYFKDWCKQIETI